jgi:hypothetical protein
MIPQLISQLISSFLLLGIVRRFKSRSSLMKIKAARMYVQGVKKMRFFFLGVLFVLVSFVFLINGLCLLQTAILTYSMWSNETKFIAALVLGGVEFLGAVGVFVYLFREETWSKFCEVQQVVNSVIVEKKSGTN